jgi:uncharacterized protein (TIGR00255 family)
MTGFGEARGELDGVSFVVEIRSVNNRYLKTTIKLPECAGYLEEKIDKLVRESLERGTVYYNLKVKSVAENIMYDLDKTILAAYIKKLKEVCDSTGVEANINVGELLAAPGVLIPVEPQGEQAQRFTDFVMELSSVALNNLMQMRSDEGRALSVDLVKHCDEISSVLDRIRKRSSVVPEEYQSRLKKKVDTLLAESKLELDQDTLAREVAVFAERADISEELSRLESHLVQFKQSCNGNDAAGRRLDFISQEMLREANTIASKASDAEIIANVVNIKCMIDRIKEQVQNVQ